MCGPAPALTPLASDNTGFVTVGNPNKKKRKGKQGKEHQSNGDWTGYVILLFCSFYNFTFSYHSYLYSYKMF